MWIHREDVVPVYDPARANQDDAGCDTVGRERGCTDTQKDTDRHHSREAENAAQAREEPIEGIRMETQDDSESD